MIAPATEREANTTALIIRRISCTSKKIMNVDGDTQGKDIEIVIPPVDCCFLVDTKAKIEDTREQAGQGMKSIKYQEVHIIAIPI